MAIPILLFVIALVVRIAVGAPVSYTHLTLPTITE